MHTSFRETGVLPDLVLSVVRDGNVQNRFSPTYRGARRGSADRDNGGELVPVTGSPSGRHRRDDETNWIRAMYAVVVKQFLSHLASMRASIANMIPRAEHG
jgi:hypothetical protein